MSTSVGGGCDGLWSPLWCGLLGGGAGGTPEDVYLVVGWFQPCTHSVECDASDGIHLPDTSTTGRNRAGDTSQYWLANWRVGGGGGAVNSMESVRFRCGEGVMAGGKGWSAVSYFVVMYLLC